MFLTCDLGQPTHTAWCSPCRMAKMCLQLKIPENAEDRSIPLPFRPKPDLTQGQERAIHALALWRIGLEEHDITTNHGLGEDAGFIGVHPRTMWSLWRRGWIHRSVMDFTPMRDKWMITDEAWAAIRHHYVKDWFE